MIDERQLREMLERRAETISATPTDEPNAIRRARRRLARNATVGGLVGLAVVVGALVGLRTIQATPAPVEPATPPPSPAALGSLAYGVDGDIYLAEWDGSNPVRIADGRPPNECGAGDWSPGEYWAEGPIWSPDGRYLAYRRANCEVSGDARWHVVISDPQGNVAAEFPGDGWDISWSPDSTRVAVWVDLREGTIGVFGVDGERQALLSVPPEMREAGDYDPVWLPDGESLLVDEVVVPIHGSAPFKDPSAGGNYSPDGSRVAYTTRKSLVIAEADGSNPREVFGDSAGSILWSPTGDRIAFVSWVSRPYMSDGQLRLLDVATGTVMLLDENEGYLSVIDFSPEGDRILFLRMEGGADYGSLWSIRADGSDLRRLVAGIHIDAGGDWLSPGPTP